MWRSLFFLGLLRVLWIWIVLVNPCRGFVRIPEPRRRLGTSNRVECRYRRFRSSYREFSMNAKTADSNGRRRSMTSQPTRIRSRRSYSSSNNKAYVEVLERLAMCPTARDVHEWIDACIDQRVHWNLSPRDETEFVRALGRRRAYAAMLLFVQKVARPTVHIYTAAMASLGSSEWHAEARRLFEEELPLHGLAPTSYTLVALFRSIRGGAAEVQEWTRRLRETYPNVPWTVQVYQAAMEACLETDHTTTDDGASWQTALQLFLEMKRKRITPHAATFEALLRVCAKAGQVRVALSLLEEALHSTPGKQPHNNNSKHNMGRVFSAALYACSQAGDYPESLRVLHAMRQHNQTVNTYHVGSLLTCLAKQGRHEEALRILVDGMLADAEVVLKEGELSVVLPPVPPDLLAVNIALDACAKSGNYDSARVLFDQLNEGHILSVDTKEPLCPDVISYNALLAGCTDYTEARMLIKEMRDSRRHRNGSVPPTSVSYTHAITACRKSDPPNVSCALSFLEMARHDGIEPNVFMYSAAIWTAERADGDHKTALSLLDEMKTAGCSPNVVSYNGVISALAVHGCGKEATSKWEEMKQNGLKPNKTSFRRLASAVRHSDKTVSEKIDTLDRIIDNMNLVERQTWLGGPIFEAKLRLCGSDSRFADAMRTFEMIEGPADLYNLRALLFACSSAIPPKWEEALSFLHTSDIVEGSKGPARMDSQALSYAVLACCKADQWEKALNLVELYAQPMSTKDEGALVSVAAFNSLVAACGRAGQPHMALRLLADMKDVFGITPNERTYRKAVIACNQAEHDRRRRQHSSAVRYQEQQDPNGFEWWEYALSLLRRMKEDGLQPDPQTYSSVISACEAAGQWQRALGVLQSMMNVKGQDSTKNEQLNLYCFNAAISACEKGGAWVEATELYFKMLDAGGVVTPNFVTLNSLLEALDKAGQKELAQSTYEDGVQNRIVSPWKITRISSGNPVRALDLHRFSSAMAKAAIRSVMESLLDGRSPDHDASNDFVIIVGKGKGSESQPVLLSTAQTVLQREYGIQARLDPSNTGRLVIDSKTLQEFEANKRWR